MWSANWSTLAVVLVFTLNVTIGSDALDEVTNSTTPSAQSKCELIHENPPLLDKEINLAFQLSMLSGLAYADWSQGQMKMSVEFEMLNEEGSREASINMIQYFRRTSKWILDRFQALFTSSHKVSNADTSSLYTSSTTSHDLQHNKPLHPLPSFHRETFKHLWFFNGWSEDGVWHDTELLISIHTTTGALAIVFRGSESVADLVTTSQLLEPIRSSRYFRNITHGSVHRGMFNAYRKVNRGYIVPLGGQDSFLRNDTASRVDSSIHEAYRKCMFGRDSDNKGGETAQDEAQNHTLKPCFATNELLSSLLMRTATKAIRAGKHVLLSGHSLGGALASFMALDLLINSNKSASFLEKDFDNEIFGNNDYEFMYHRASDSSHVSHLGRQFDTQTLTRKKLLNDIFFKKIYLYTFGEPEVADNHFFHDVFTTYGHVGDFVTHRCTLATVVF